MLRRVSDEDGDSSRPIVFCDIDETVRSDAEINSEGDGNTVLGSVGVLGLEKRQQVWLNKYSFSTACIFICTEATRKKEFEMFRLTYNTLCEGSSKARLPNYSTITRPSHPQDMFTKFYFFIRIRRESISTNLLGYQRRLGTGCTYPLRGKSRM